MAISRFSKLETNETMSDTERDTSHLLSERITAPDLSQPDRESDGGAEPVSFDGVMRTAETHFLTGEWKLALRYYSRALQMDNSQVDPWVHQVLALLFMEQMREADVWARRALECFPEDPTVISIQGLVSTLMGMKKRGLGSSDFAMGQGRMNPFIWLARGWMLLESNNRNWEGCFDKVFEMGAEVDWRHFMMMGQVLSRYKKWPRALQCYQKATEGQTSNFFLWQQLGCCYEKLGLSRQAMEAFQHAQSLRPNDANIKAAAKKSARFSPVAFIRRVIRRPKKKDDA